MNAQKLNLRDLLLKRSRWVEEHVLEKAESNGYGDITPAMNRLYAHLGGRTLTLSELARRLSISRQAVHKMAQEGIAAGYVEMLSSPTDARVKLLRFSDKGRAMAASATGALEELEVGLAREIGEAQLNRIKTLLAMPWSTEERLRANALKKR